MNNGYIKLHRKVMDSAVFCNPNLWQVWCWALLRANHKRTSILFHGTQIYLEPGEFVSGRYAGAAECRMNPSTFWDRVKKLVEMGNLNIKSDNKKTIFAIVKWAQYQIREVESDSTPDNSPTTARQQPDTDKNVRMEETDAGVSAPTNAFDSLWSEYPRREGKKEALRHFRASVKSEADLGRIRLALANYKAKLQREHTEPRYIQKGSTWFNNWQDWENVEPPKPRAASPLVQFGGV